MATHKQFTLDRIKSILEFNMRKTRVKGVEYSSAGPGTNPDGTENLKDESDLTLWDTSKLPTAIKESNQTRHMLYELNTNLRDAVAQTIFDVLGGSGSDDSQTDNSTLEAIYESSPSNGDNDEDGNGNYYIEVPTDKTIMLKVGNYILEVTNTNIRYSSTGGAPWTILI